MAPSRLRSALPLALGLLGEWRYRAWAQQTQAVGPDDNPCYLDAELGCAAERKNCGLISDLCDGQIDCGNCTDPCDPEAPVPGCRTCEENVCTCHPTNCIVVDAHCGTIPDSCGGALPCGRPCVDDPDWLTSGGASCETFAMANAAGLEWDCAAPYALSDAGVPATEACPVTCGTGCSVFMIDYDNPDPSDGRCGAGDYCNGSRSEYRVGNATHWSMEMLLDGSARCMTCPDGFEPDPQQHGCVPCPPGSAGVGGICTPCLSLRSKWMETLTPNAARTACECTPNPPDNCSATNCGTTPDGCGGTIECGGCETLVGSVFGFACNHTLSECECVPDTCEVMNATCGAAVADGCGGWVDCSECEEKND